MTQLLVERLEQVFTLLGLSYPDELNTDDDYPPLIIDDQILVHFKEATNRIEIIAALGGLPTSAALLTKLLTLNYSSADHPLCFASDAEGNDLLAIIHLPLEAEATDIHHALVSMIEQIEEAKRELETVHADITLPPP